MNLRTVLTRAVAAGFVAAAVAGLAPAAQAALPAQAAPAQRADAVCHLVEADSSVRCFGSHAEAQRELGTTADVLGARFWSGTGRTGSVLDFMVPRACSPEYDFEGPAFRIDNLDFGLVNWSNAISSVRTFNRCDVRLHDPINLGTPYSTWIDASDNLGNIGTGWNDRASSLRLS